MASGDHASSGYDYNTVGLIADGVSMLGDVTSLAGGIPGVVGGATTLVSDIVGDIAKEKPILSILGNAALNIGWGIAGVIPGVKSAKVVKTASRIIAAASSAGVAMNPDVQNSWKKILDGDFSNITKADFENYKWTLHALTGSANAIRGARIDRGITNSIRSNGKNIKLADRTTKDLLPEQFAEVSRLGRRKGQKAAVDKATEYLG